MTLQEMQTREEFKKKLEALEATIEEIRARSPKGTLPSTTTVWKFSQTLWDHGNEFRNLLMKN